MENQNDIDMSDSFAKAIARAMRRRGHAEWRIAAQILLERLNAHGLSPKRILITDAWGEEEDRPYYWDGDGQFTLQYFPQAKDIAPDEIIDAIIEQLISEGIIECIEDKSSDGGNPYRWIKANTRTR